MLLEIIGKYIKIKCVCKIFKLVFIIDQRTWFDINLVVLEKGVIYQQPVVTNESNTDDNG